MAAEIRRGYEGPIEPIVSIGIAQAVEEHHWLAYHLPHTPVCMSCVCFSRHFSSMRGLMPWWARVFNGRELRVLLGVVVTLRDLRRRIGSIDCRVGADNPVTAADLVPLCRMETLELGIWLREALALRHCQYP